MRVTGTTFDAAWDPMAETFELTMIEGRVVVTGPSLPPERTVVGGEHLVVSVRDGKMVLSSVRRRLRRAGPRRRRRQTRRRAPRLLLRSAPRAALRRGELGGRGSPLRPSGRDLAASGKYRDAFAAAEAAGFSQEVERAPVGDLLMLADAARFSGSAARAREALLAARRRFGVRGQSAFLLGKIAADQQGSPGDAVGWFETYLQEQPGGPLAEQALGRIVDLVAALEARRRAPGGGALPRPLPGGILRSARAESDGEPVSVTAPTPRSARGSSPRALAWRRKLPFFAAVPAIVLAGTLALAERPHVVILGPSTDHVAVVRMRSELAVLGIDVDVLVHAKNTANLEAVARRLGAVAALRVETSPPAIVLWVDPAVAPPGTPPEVRVGGTAEEKDPALLALRAVEVLRAKLVKVPLALPPPHEADAEPPVVGPEAGPPEAAPIDAAPPAVPLEAGLLAPPAPTGSDAAAPPRAERAHTAGFSAAPAVLLSPGGVSPSFEARIGAAWDPSRASVSRRWRSSP